MQVTRLEARNFRGFAEVSFEPAPGLNLITGDNGAGKTSLLEALHLMAYGRSFRGRVRDGLVRAGTSALEVFVEWREGQNAASDGERSARRAGLRHNGQAWTGRLDGAAVSHLTELCAALAVVSFEPGSHALISGGAENRRRFLDWGMFHVEQDFVSVSRRYSRALRQRNALLKARASAGHLDAWDHELAEAGEPLTRGRQRYVDALLPLLQETGAELVPSVGMLTAEYAPGWRRDEMPLADALLLARSRDMMMGYTSVGPHRGDWRVRLGDLPGREALSRGQTKLVALAALLSQAEHHAHVRGDWPIVALDDLSSELDRVHQGRILQRLLATGSQVFATGTEVPASMRELPGEFALFHVEHRSIEHFPAPD
ncbi:MAG: DNA replication/repair protein RecF [Pseudomonadota bacterium]|nr:DNA replication/repair protein RecF [Pseudomonadota bacterium]